MSARDKLIELAEYVVAYTRSKEGCTCVSCKMRRMAEEAINAVQEEQHGPHAPLRCVLCGEEVGVMETATHKCT